MARIATYIIMACLALAASRALADANIHILANFIPAPNGLNPSYLIEGKDGNLYGTTFDGGTYQNGTLFRITPAGAITTLHSFVGPNDGCFPDGLVQGTDGNFYGTAAGSGPNPATIFKWTTRGAFSIVANLGNLTALHPGLVQGRDGNFYGMHDTTVFKVTPSGVFTDIGTAPGNSIGGIAVTPLIAATDGKIYGCCFDTVFSVGMDGTITPLAQVANTGLNNLLQAGDGNFYCYGQSTQNSLPQDSFFRIATDGTVTNLTSTAMSVYSLAAGIDGNMYGTANDGVSETNYVFKLSTSGVITVLQTLPAPVGTESTFGSVLQDKRGNLYGSFGDGGTYGMGSAFGISSKGIYKQLHVFAQTGGSTPEGPLAQDARGNIYGTTYYGGPSDNGTVFKLITGGGLTTIASFDGDNGEQPNGLTIGKDGNFYGTTYYGGDSFNGAAFRVTPTGALTSLHSFNINTAQPSELLLARDGNFYGTYQSAAGGVFKMTPSGITTTVIALDFSGPLGQFPDGNLVQALDGTIYGFTDGGAAIGGGAIFAISPSGTASALYSFYSVPASDLLVGADGNLYGADTTSFGTVYQVTPSGSFTTFATFDNSTVFFPTSGLIQDSAGNFYGVTSIGGTSNLGGVFKIDPKGNVTVLGNFDSGGWPGKLLIGKDGNLYGTNDSGGTANAGFIYRVILPKLPPPRRAVVVEPSTASTGMRQ